MNYRKSVFNILLILICCFLNGCGDAIYSDLEEKKIFKNPSGFPSIVFPEGNEYSQSRWELGKRLFYDSILSVNNTISCSSCHKSENAFSDTVPFSKGDGNLFGRGNAPTLANIGYNPYFTRAGGVPTLEMQILVPIQEHDEFNTNILDIVEKLKQDSSYTKLARKAYKRELDPFVITRAIANFERSFISGNSDYDKFHFQNKKKLMSESQQRGEILFESERTSCTQCHSGFNFTNYAFENNGLYLNYKDIGRKRLTKNEFDLAKFKVPTLRNIELTGPYMHDGSIKTLADVINHYNSGGQIHKNKSSFIKPLGLNEIEKQDLEAFLKSLTDKKFVTNKIYKK